MKKCLTRCSSLLLAAFLLLMPAAPFFSASFAVETNDEAAGSVASAPQAGQGTLSDGENSASGDEEGSSGEEDTVEEEASAEAEEASDVL